MAVLQAINLCSESQVASYEALNSTLASYFLKQWISAVSLSAIVLFPVLMPHALLLLQLLMQCYASHTCSPVSLIQRASFIRQAFAACDMVVDALASLHSLAKSSSGGGGGVGVSELRAIPNESEA